MNREEIEKLVDEFLEMQPNKFSEFWRDDLVKRVAKLESKKTISAGKITGEEKLRREKDCQKIIEITHDEKFLEIVEICETALRRKFYSVLGDVDIEFIMIEASAQWWLKFDVSKSKAKNPELNFLKLLVKNALSLYVRNHNLQNVSLDDIIYGLEDPKDYFENEIEKDAQAEKEERDHEFINSGGTNSLPVKFGSKFFPYFAFNEIFRYYSLTDKVEYTSGVRKREAKIVEIEGKPAYIEIIQPKLKAAYRHDKETFVGIHQELITDQGSAELLNVNNSASFYRRRWEIMRSTDTVRWMELAVSLIAESKEKKISDIAKLKENDVEGRSKIEKAPALGAVVVCRDGRFFTCFRGQFDQKIIEKGKVRDITWDKHCEYSLFVEAVKEENLHLLEGGTLYVTLEPCNSRTSMKIGSRQLKIPCAVRCVEAKLKKIYLGSFDYNKRVLGKGREILETGLYRFDLENGKHKEYDLDEQGNRIPRSADQINAAKRLEHYFRVEKEYPVEDISNSEQLVFRIGKPVEIGYFDRELMLRVYNYNSEFMRKHRPEAFTD